MKNSSQVPDKAVLDADPAFMRRVFDSLEHPFYVIDARDYTIQFANRATTNISSLRLGVDTCYAVTHRRSTPCVGDHPCPLEEVCRTHRPAKMEHIHYHRDGQPYPVEVHGEPVFDDEGNLAYMIEYCLDIRARKEMEHALAQAAQVFHHAHEGIIIADADGRIERVNEGFTAITGYTTEEAVGQRPGDLLGSGWHDADFFAGMWEEVRTTGAWQGEIWNRRRSGEIYPQWLSLNAVPRGNGEAGGYIAIFSDITEHKEQESDLLRKAYSDPLTGLPNRFTLEDRAGQAQLRSQRGDFSVSLLFIDLDRFKVVNDRYGHRAGDDLLREVGRRIGDVLRRTDTVARVGGDEFIVLLEDDTGLGGAETVAEKILAALQEPFALPSGVTARVGASLGVARCQPHSEDSPDIPAIIAAADNAMYAAKAAGGNRYRIARI